MQQWWTVTDLLTVILLNSKTTRPLHASINCEATKVERIHKGGKQFCPELRNIFFSPSCPGFCPWCAAVSSVASWHSEQTWHYPPGTHKMSSFKRNKNIVLLRAQVSCGGSLLFLEKWKKGKFQCQKVPMNI